MGRRPVADLFAKAVKGTVRTRNARIPARYFRPRQLKAVFNIGAGADRITMLPNIARLMKGAAIIRLNDAGLAAQMAEYVCHALFQHTREFAVYKLQQQRLEWKTLPGIDRAAWPVGVMGLGSIGERVARAIAAFDYPIFGWSRTQKSLPGVSATGNGVVQTYTINGSIAGGQAGTCAASSCARSQTRTLTMSY